MAKKKRRYSQPKVDVPLRDLGISSSGMLAGWRRAGLIALVIAGIAVFLYAGLLRFFHRSPPVSGATEAARSGYVDSSSCPECHESISKTYSHTGMSHSLALPGSKMVEDFTAKNTLYHPASGDYYTMIRRGDGYYQQRYQKGFDGRPTDMSEERIDYVIGSGDQARSYLHRSSEGRLVELPVTWYSEDRGHWGMTPGYEGANQKDFHGVVSKECIFCHDAYPAMEAKEIGESGEPIFQRPLPQGIDCQRCHGPGAEHVRVARTKSYDAALIRSSIVNPANLGRERQMEVCMECHLSTSGSQDTNISLRFNRDVFSYRPGTPLADYKLYFDVAEEQDKHGFQIADAAYRLRMSNCFRNSQMTCLTCHDPHEEAHGKEAQTQYLETCQKCHSEVKHAVSLPSTETCLSCHMPRRRGEYATQIVLTDHYIQRQKPAGNLLAPITAAVSQPKGSGSLAIYYPEKLPESSESKLYMAIAEIEGTTGSLVAANHLEAAINEFKPVEAEYYAALGEAYARSGRYTESVAWLQKAWRAKPNDREIVEQYVEALIAFGDLGQAENVLKEAVGHPPPDARLLANLGNIYLWQGRLDEAEKDLNQAVESDPELAQTYNLLGMLKEKQGNAAIAEKLYRQALQQRPDLAEARNNLGKLLVASGGYDEAEFQFKQAIVSAPSFAEAHHSYGLLSIVTKRRSQAEKELNEAVVLAPQVALFHSDLADLLAQTDRPSEARQQFSEALKRDPNLDEANLGLGLLLGREGNSSAAKGYCQKALMSSNPAVRDEAESCMRR